MPEEIEDIQVERKKKKTLHQFTLTTVVVATKAPAWLQNRHHQDNTHRGTHKNHLVIVLLVNTSDWSLSQSITSNK